MPSWNPWGPLTQSLLIGSLSCLLLLGGCSGGGGSSTPPSSNPSNPPVTTVRVEGQVVDDPLANATCQLDTPALTLVSRAFKT